VFEALSLIHIRQSYYLNEKGRLILFMAHSIVRFYCSLSVEWSVIWNSLSLSFCLHHCKIMTCCSSRTSQRCDL